MKKTHFFNIKLFKQSGITLIALVVTIIVLLILTGFTVSILTGNNGLIERASSVQFKNDVKLYEEELLLSIASEEVDALGNRTNVINVSKKDFNTENAEKDFEDKMKEYIEHFNYSKYGNKLEIRNDELVYTDETNIKERQWFTDVKLSLSKIFITVNYIDKNRNKLSEPERIETTTGKYIIYPISINNYEPEKLLYEGKVTKDTEINIVYFPESHDLVFIPLDINGNEILDENKLADDSTIVAYKVGDNQNFSHENLVIPKTHNNKPVTQIKSYAFSRNNTIKTASIPETITKIEGYTFNNCTNLEILRTNVENSTDAYEPNKYNARSIKHLELGKNVKSIGVQSFNYCNNLTDITIYSNNITRLHAGSFAGCNNIKEIKVNSDNTGYTIVDGLLCSKDEKTLVFYPIGRENEDFIIPNKIEIIGESACAYNNYLKRVNISSNIKLINANAFNRCDHLEYLNLNAEKVTGAYVFRSSSLSKVDIGENVKSISGAAFGTSTNLTDVTIYSEKADITGYQFLNCSSLRTFKLKDNHTKYTEINGCLYTKDLKTLCACPAGIEGELTILDDVEIIKGQALLSKFPSLTKFILPISIKNVDISYFEPLTEIYYKGTKEDWNKVTINSTNSYVKTVICSDGTVSL